MKTIRETNNMFLRCKPLFHYIILQILLMNECFQLCHGYCWQGGKNPSIPSPPIVTQITITKVQVSWKGIVKSKDCVDSYRVKYWKKGSEQNYKMSEKVSSEIDGVILEKIVPRVEYSFQAVAIEDKGLFGIDYNRSPIARLSTSRLETKKKKLNNDDSLNIVKVKSREKTEKGNADKVVTLSTQPTPPKNDKDLVVLESKDSGIVTAFGIRVRMTLPESIKPFCNTFTLFSIF